MDGNRDIFIIQQDPKNRLNRNTNALWVEDAFASDHKPLNEDREENNFLGIAVGSEKITRVTLVLLFGMLLLFGRVFFLQVIKGGHYRQIADGNRIREYYVRPIRGVIYDRDGRQLVENIPTFSLYVVPADLPRKSNERVKLFHSIHDIINRYNFDKDARTFVSELENRLKDIIYYSYLPVLVKENITYDEAVLLKISSRSMPGITVKIENRRQYLIQNDGDNVESLSHILGYLGRISPQELERVPVSAYENTDTIGKNGLELKYEAVLRGQRGKETLEVDALGKPEKIMSRRDPVNGNGIKINIDFKLQAFIEKLLKENLKKQGLGRASAIVLNPKNGEVLALVGLPSYDINIFARGIKNNEYQALLENPDKPLFNRAISGEYPSGSSFKPIVAAAALEEGVVNFNTLIRSSGGIRIKQWFFPDWKDGGHGLVNVTRAISESVNTYFYYIGGGNQEDFAGLGVKRIKKYAQEFGLSKITGIDIPGERPGFLPDPEWKLEAKNERWYIGDTYHLAIGQGDILVTPLQMASATAVFANGGKLYAPRIVRQIIPHSPESREIPPLLMNENFISSKNLEIISLGMRKTVVSGSARLLKFLPIKIAGKTGTAQWNKSKKPHSWFTSFGPVDDPVLVVTVLIEEAQDGSAAPIAGEIYKWIYENERDDYNI